MQKGGSEQKEKERKTQTKEKSKKREKRTVSITKEKRSLCQFQTFNIRESESFYYTKVNQVLYTHALQIILFRHFYVRTQHYYESLQIVSSQFDLFELFLLLFINLYFLILFYYFNKLLHLFMFYQNNNPNQPYI